MSGRRFHNDIDRDDEAEEAIGIEENSNNSYVLDNDDNNGENLDENPEQDYLPNENLDQYDAKELDENEYSQMSIEARRKADLAIEQREQRKRHNKKLGQNRNLPHAVRVDYDGFEQEEDSIDLEQRKNAFRAEQWNDDNLDIDPEVENEFLDFQKSRGKLSEWINKPETRRWIRKSFRMFLERYQDENGQFVYMNRIDEMIGENSASLEINYPHLSSVFPTISYWVFESPTIIIKELNRVALDLIKSINYSYSKIKTEIYVKIIDFPLEEKIRELRTSHVNNLIKIRGVITRRNVVQSQLTEFWFICQQCGQRNGPEFITENGSQKVRQCVSCQKNGPFEVDKEKVVYKNHQRIVVQESPSTVPPGRVPRNKEVLLLNDNIDCARPGDEVEITGIFLANFDIGMNIKHGFPLFSTSIEANSVRRVNEIEMTEITPSDRMAIIELSRNPNIFEMVVNSIAPSIYGHPTIKTALALALFGGTPIEGGTHRVRGDINVLLVGDPGLSKSQFLKYVQSISPRAIYTTGKGASAVGLTACVQKDPVSGEWMLEGGALVLADQGICLIDEFDKMNEGDRTSIHEAMEQQSISISKAGIVANLPARCSVIAAANPIRGLYDNQLSFQDNLNLSEPILSRFDVLCVLKDEFNLDHDRNLANFIINSHARSHPDNIYEEQTSSTPNVNPVFMGENKNFGSYTTSANSAPKLSQAMLKKYMMYAKNNYKPRLTESCRQKIQNFYVKLRGVSQTISSVTIVVRHLESMIRFCEASAKIHLRSEVNDKDVDIAIEMLLKSFLQSTKPSIAKNLERRFFLELNAKKNNSSLLSHLLNELVRDQVEYFNVLKTEKLSEQQTMQIKIPVSVLEEKAKEHSIHSLEEFFRTDVFRQNYALMDQFIIKDI